MKKYIIPLLLLIPSLSWGACSWSDNTGTVDVSGTYTYQDVQDCVTDASSKTGDVIIQIPDSTLSNNSAKITANMKTGFANVTSLTIKGQNDCTLGHTDVVTGGVPTSCTTIIDKLALEITGNTSKKVRISNIELTGTTASYPPIHMLGDTNVADGGGFRIDHMYFHSSSGGENGMIRINHNNHSWKQMSGVVDHVHGYEINRLMLYQPGGGNTVSNKDWIEPLGLGTSNAIYLEDSKLLCSDTSHQAIEHQGGGRTVVRHNHITDFWFGAHDASSIINSRGLRKYEFYENTFIFDVHAAWCIAMTPRGGSGVIFNNSIDNTAQLAGNRANYIGNFYIQRLSSYTSNPTPWNTAVGAGGKVCANAPSYACVACTAETDCGGTNGVTNYCVDKDGVGDGDPLPLGYPARDQLGVIQNSDGSQTGGGAPFLLWGNTLNGAAFATVRNGSTTYMIDGRDYCSTTSTTMPSSCNGIATTYTPYTYPHPLTGGGGEDETAPTVTAASVRSGGTTVIFTFSEPITATSGAAFTLDIGTAVTLTCPAVETAASSLTCTTSRTIYQSEGNSTFDYTGTKVVDEASNALAAISNQAIQNLSTQVETPPAVALTISSHTGAVVTTSPSGIACGSTCTADFETGTTVTVTGYCLPNYSGFTITSGKDCNTETGAVAMSAAKECAAYCTKIAASNKVGSGPKSKVGSGAKHRSF